MQEDKKYKLAIYCSILLLVLIIILSLFVGSISIWTSIWLYITQQITYIDNTVSDIIFFIRLPRIITAGLVGAALALCGLLLQTVLDNPLADPYTLGIASGSAASVAILIVVIESFALSFMAYIWIPAAAMLGAVLSLLFVLWGTRGSRINSSEQVILLGTALQIIGGAILTFSSYISYPNSSPLTSWLLGSMNNTNWDKTHLLFIVLIISILWTRLWYRELNILLLGEIYAFRLGVNVLVLKRYIFIISSLLTAFTVSLVGIIGFVGFIIPRFIHWFIGTEYRYAPFIIPLFGAIFLIIVDTISRSIFTPRELPLGVITAFIASPWFLWLLISKKVSRGG